jgi:hypothetical protein
MKLLQTTQQSTNKTLAHREMNEFPNRMETNTENSARNSLTLFKGSDKANDPTGL